MKRVVRTVDEERGIVQVTTTDERWYLMKREVDGKEIIIEVPSVTWITDSYPKGIQFFKWLADKGWDEAEAIKQAAGDKGSKVHKAIQSVIEGSEVRIDSKYVNPSTEQEEELTLEECEAVLSFVNWKNELKPKFLLWESVLFSEHHNVAGTLDAVYTIEGETNTIHLVDWKTSQQVWPSFELQVSAYKKLLEERLFSGELKLEGIDIKKPLTIIIEILQVGYRRNKNNYKLTQLEDKFPLFLAAQQIWRNEHGDEKPKQKEIPIVLSPALTAENIFPTPEAKVEEPPKKKVAKKVKKAKVKK